MDELKGKACEDWRRQELVQFMQQLVVDNHNIDTLMNIGALHAALGEDAAAFRYLWLAYDQHKERFPESAGRLDITMALAELHMGQNQYVEAKRKYWEAMQIDWGCQRAHDGLHSAKKMLELHPPKKRYPDPPEPVSAEVIQMLNRCGPIVR